jgi:hypothetical protein
MKPTKAFIIMMKGNLISEEYAKVCSDSCDKIGLEWEYIEWFDGNHGGPNVAMDAWAKVPTKILNVNSFKPKRNTAQCATSGHAMAWCKVRDHGKPAIILEHDAVMFHKIDIDLIDNCIIALGYKIQKLEDYDHVTAGPPTEIVDVIGAGHEGAHAYAITPETARLLLKELEDIGIPGAIDNTHFLKSRKTKVPIKIMSPTPAVGWLRKSTIWAKSATKNYPFIGSFAEHYIGAHDTTHPRHRPKMVRKQKPKPEPEKPATTNNTDVYKNKPTNKTAGYRRRKRI